MTTCEAEQIHKMTIIFTQKDNPGRFWFKKIVILWIYSGFTTDPYFSASDKSHDLTAKWVN